MNRLLALALAAGVFAPSIAGASIILQQDPIENGGGLSSSPTYQGYDDFKLTQTSTIVALRWWAQDFSVNTRTFQIRFTDANGFYPNAAAPLYSTTVVATGVSAGAFTYRFDATLPVSAVLAGATNLFVSISADGFTWGRASDHPSPGSLGGASDSYNTATNSHTLQGQDLAWALSDTPFASSVPEPGTWAMMAVGFGMVGAAAHARRRRAALQGA